MFPELYHAHHSRSMEDLPFWQDLAARTGGPILELGCGTGRLLVPLAQAGYHLIGLDHDLSMLRFLQTNADLINEAGTQIIATDICQFNLATQFPLIILPCNTYSTLSTSERLACLRCVYKHLKRDGIFVVSSPNPELLKNLPRRAAEEMEDEFLHPGTDNPVQVSSSWRRTLRIFTVTWSYDELLPNGSVNRLEARVSHQMMTTQACLDEFKKVGFNQLELFGDFDRSEYTQESVNLIILVGRQ